MCYFFWMTWFFSSKIIHFYRHPFFTSFTFSTISDLTVKLFIFVQSPKFTWNYSINFYTLRLAKQTRLYYYMNCFNSTKSTNLQLLMPVSRVQLMSSLPLSVSTLSNQKHSHTDSLGYGRGFWTAGVNTCNLVLPQISDHGSNSDT